MPHAAETVLKAGLSYKEGWENRLTAILATVLNQHWGFASALFRQTGLPTGATYEAFTEEWVTPGRRVDMQIVARDAKGAVVSQIWSEHKRAGGAFSTDQREDYLAALLREPGEGRLMTVVAGVRDAVGDSASPTDEEDTDLANRLAAATKSSEGNDLSDRPGEPSLHEPRWWGLTWQLIAEIAYGAGTAFVGPWGGPDWMKTALAREAPAAQRALFELLWYLDEEGYAVVTPFRPEHLQSLRHGANTYKTCVNLLGRAADAMAPLMPDGECDDEDPHGYAQTFETPKDAWPERLDGDIELLAWDDDGWLERPTGEPALAAGVSLAEDWHRPLGKNHDWVHRLHAAGFSFAAYDGWVACYATIPLREVIEKGGESLAEQSDYVAHWAKPLVLRLISDEFDPGAVEPAVRPKSSRRNRSSTTAPESQ